MCVKCKHRPHELLDEVKRHPSIRRLIQGGEVKEYAAHLIPEGGYHSIPRLSGNGWCITGDAAQLVNFIHREGTNLAMISGRLAAEAVIKAKERGDFSAAALKHYDDAIRGTFVINDLKKYKGMHALLKDYDPAFLFRHLPQAVNDAAYEMFLVNGVSKAEKQRKAVKLVKEAAGGAVGLMKLGVKGWRSING